jgi:hypothetical protein
MRRYVWILLCCAVPAALAGLFWPIVGITLCHGDRYSQQSYLAYCESTGYGDYEHAALWFDLEPEAVANLQRAEVLVIGDSRTQVAFSTAATRAFAAASGWRFYLLGFGYNEDSAFPKVLFNRYQLRPRAVIINADPFFTAKGSDASSRLLSGTDLVTDYVRLRIKRWAQDLQRAVCRGTALSRYACGGGDRTIYRSRIDGGWDTTWWKLERTFPLPAEPPRYGVSVAELIAAGDDFVASLGVDRRCVLFTVTPSNFSASAVTREVAQALGVQAIVPAVNNLTTYDHSHLNEASAERWSAAFFALAEPFIRACVQR